MLKGKGIKEALIQVAQITRHTLRTIGLNSHRLYSQAATI
jgi:hypothetical protein